MQIQFHGAAREVTGSCHLVDTGQTRFIVDCGMFQGTKFAEEKNYEDFGFDPQSLDFVILTHAHLDHCGRLPKLCRGNFKAPIYCTPPTKDFAEIIMRDSAKIIMYESKEDGHAPLYRDTEVNGALKNFRIIEYHKAKKVAPDVTIKYYDAGHVLGSAFVEVTIGTGLKKKKIVFSGDLGNPPVPLLRDTEFITGADIVILESTYGGRVHEPVKQRHDILKEVFSRTISGGGVLMIPAFALERTQELLYELNHLVENKEVPPTKIYVDSPLAIKATNIYRKYPLLYDQESTELIAKGDDLFSFPNLKFTKTSAQSKEINKSKHAKVIIAGSGMVNGGRILHHLKRYLGDKKNQLLIIGYQAEGTIGRQLLDGAKSVTIDKRQFVVKAKIKAIGAYSAHADHPKLIDWVSKMKKPKPKKIFLVHGEKASAAKLKIGLKQKLNITVEIPEYGKTYKL